MLFYLSLPIALAISLAADVVWQHHKSHFVDLDDLMRRALLVVLLWTAGGWWLEAQEARRLATFSATRLVATEQHLDYLRFVLNEALSQ